MGAYWASSGFEVVVDNVCAWSDETLVSRTADVRQSSVWTLKLFMMGGFSEKEADCRATIGDRGSPLGKTKMRLFARYRYRQLFYCLQHATNAFS